MINRFDAAYKIILFDGVCNFCNYWVNFVLVRDRKDQFRFAALQSESGQKLLSEFNLPKNDFDSFILMTGHEIKKKSLAIFEIAKTLGGWLIIIYFFKFLPILITDFIYDLIANNRYKIFGKRNICRVPTEEEKNKFL